jgi:hypothetical protein
MRNDAWAASPFDVTHKWRVPAIGRATALERAIRRFVNASSVIRSPIAGLHKGGGMAGPLMGVLWPLLRHANGLEICERPDPALDREDGKAPHI